MAAQGGNASQEPKKLINDGSTLGCSDSDGTRTGMNMLVFCISCNTMLQNYNDMEKHVSEKNHDVFWASSNPDHELFCVNCNTAISSLIHLKNHKETAGEDHMLYKIRALPPGVKILKKNSLYITDDVEVIEGIAYDEDDDEDVEDGSSKQEIPITKEEYDQDDCDPLKTEDGDDGDIAEDDDDVIEDRDSTCCDPSLYTPHLSQSDSDDSQHENSSDPVFHGRVLKKLILCEKRRNDLRGEYVICEARRKNVVLRRVRKALKDYKRDGYFTCRKRVVAYDFTLKQVCFKKSGSGYKCAGLKGLRLCSLLTIVESVLRKDNVKSLRENSLHYMFRKELAEPELKDGQMSVRIRRAINDLSVMLRVSRESLGIKAAPKGFVCGELLLYSGEKVLTDCRLGGSSGSVIPVEAEWITSIAVAPDLRFVLSMEKDTVYHTLVEQEFHINNKCILMTGRGHPDVATRVLLRKLRDALPKEIPFYCLVDCNPAGAIIFSTFALGSEEHSHDNLSLTVPDLIFAGVKVADVPKNELVKLSASEKKKVKKLLSKKYLPGGEGSLRENLKDMISGGKADIDVLYKSKDQELVEYLESRIPEARKMPTTSTSQTMETTLIRRRCLTPSDMVSGPGPRVEMVQVDRAQA